METFEPMLCGTFNEDAEYDPRDWRIEPKLDGVRCVIHWDGRKLRAFSRSQKEATESLPELKELEATLRRDGRVLEFVVDTEMVVKVDGVMDFDATAGRFHRKHATDDFAEKHPATFIAFDITEWSKDLTSYTYDERRPYLNTLTQLLNNHAGQDLFELNSQIQPYLRDIHAASSMPGYSPEEHFKRALEVAVEHGYEGYVMKHKDSTYAKASRSKHWLKRKPFFEDSYVVLGWSAGTGRRKKLGLGHLHIGKPDESGEVHYAGKVGAGISDVDISKLLAALRPHVLHSVNNPYEHIRDADIVAWTTPSVWIEVKFQERTKHGKLRFPAYLRLRPDLTDGLS